MSKKMLINATHPEENRVAIVEDGILTELDIEIAGKEQTRGNVYKAVVVRVEPGLQAAFIDYGAERFGFLQMGEIHPAYFRDSEGRNGADARRQRITDVLKRGQELLVQVVKEERGTKGAALTTFLSLPGRYMVLMPDSDTKGVSRKIEEEPQRKKLKEAMASLALPPNMGYIVRTAGIGQKKEELRRDFDYLVRVWEKIREEARQARAPLLIYKESNLVIRSIRDYFGADMDEVLVDDPRVCQEAKDFFQQVMPEYARLVKLHQEKRPIFARYQIEEQIETISKNKVPLPSGGSIVIDATEALVAIDVNSGKMAGEQNIETTAYKTNLEAAAEAARQLRLRDLGGLIVVDFIDMRDRKHIREVEKCLKEALKFDKARVTVGRISQFGLLEMSRQRIKAALAEGAYLPCPHCSGSGRIKSAEAQAIAFLRKIHAAVAKGQIARVEGEIPLDVATYLLNIKREELLELERQHQMMIIIKGRPDFMAGQSELTVQKREREEMPASERTPAPPAEVSAETFPLQQLPAEAPAAPVPAATSPVGNEHLAAEPAGETDEDAGRKKRKRRRRKKKPEEIAASVATEETPAEETPAEMPPAEVSVAEVLQPAAVEPEERKKKRRRRRKKKPAEPLEVPVAEAGNPVGEPAEAPIAPEFEITAPEKMQSAGPAEKSPAEGGAEAEPKPASRKRRRSRKKPETPVPAAQPAEAAPAENSVQPEIHAQHGILQSESHPDPEADKPLVTKPKKASSRKAGARKPVPHANAEAEASESAAAVLKPDETPASPAKPATKRPARRQAPKRSADTGHSQAAEETEKAKKQTETVSATAEPSKEKKPKRRSSRKKTATSLESEPEALE